MAKPYLFVGVDRAGEAVVAQLFRKAVDGQPYGRAAKAVRYRIHVILIDNAIRVAEQPRNRNTARLCQMRFDMIVRPAISNSACPNLATSG